MESINIHVPASIAKAYTSADKETRKKTEILLNIHLQQIFNSVSPKDRLLNILNKGADEAKKNGLTPEMFNELMKDE